jgi:hypothetical protein
MKSRGTRVESRGPARERTESRRSTVDGRQPANGKAGLEAAKGTAGRRNYRSISLTTEDTEDTKGGTTRRTGFRFTRSSRRHGGVRLIPRRGAPRDEVFRQSRAADRRASDATQFRPLRAAIFTASRHSSPAALRAFDCLKHTLCEESKVECSYGGRDLPDLKRDIEVLAAFC